MFSEMGYRDQLFNMVIAFMALASLAFVAVSSPQKTTENSNGRMSISMAWSTSGNN